MTSIDKIGATAFVIASIRESEDSKPEPLFTDPYAAWFSSDFARTAARGIDAAFPPSTTMVRFRTRYFNRFIERGIEAGAVQVVLLGGGFDMRAHIFARDGVTFFEVDRKPVIDFKSKLLDDRGTVQPPSLPIDYLEGDLTGGLEELGLDPNLTTLIVWEGNTMYLPAESIMPFLNRLADGLARFRIAFDHFVLDLMNRDPDSIDIQRVEGIEQAMHVRFLTGFPDLAAFENETPLRVAESGSFADLGREYGMGPMVDGYPEDWRRTLEIYRYCVLATQ
ncbi:MAG: class I SAM-dependent methyltransferase [Gemmatimonadetes bacterium]|nr:class I SAM-dependent methyltransferase [Gemmatimonadota bacterium]